MAAGCGADRRRHRASDPARAVRRHGRRAASRAVLAPDAARPRADGRPSVRRPARKRRARGRGPFPPSRRPLPRRLGLGDRPPLPGGRAGQPRHHHRRRRGVVCSGALPPGLDAGRRHRSGQGPPGRRHRARQLAARPQAGAVAVAVGQAPGGRAPRLDRDGRPRCRRVPARQLPPGGRDPARRGHPVCDLCDAALAGPPGKGVAPRPDRRLARGLARRGRPPRLSGRHRLRRGARDGQRGRVEGQPRRGETVPAGPRRTAASERAAGRAHRLCVGDRRHHRPRPRLCRQARALGRRRDALRDPHRLHLRDGGGRGRGDGGARARPEGPRPLPGPRTLL